MIGLWNTFVYKSIVARIDFSSFSYQRSQKGHTHDGAAPDFGDDADDVVFVAGADGIGNTPNAGPNGAFWLLAGRPPWAPLILFRLICVQSIGRP